MHYLEAERWDSMISANVFIEECGKLDQLLVAELNVWQGICVQKASQVRMSDLDRVVPRLVKPRYAVEANAIVSSCYGHQAMSLPAHYGTLSALSPAAEGGVDCAESPPVQPAACHDPIDLPAHQYPRSPGVTVRTVPAKPCSNRVATTCR